MATFQFSKEEALNLVTTVSGHKETMVSAFDKLTKAANAIDSSWKGQGASAFIAQYQELTANFEKLIQIFGEGMESAKYAADHYTASDESAAATMGTVDTQKGIAPVSFPTA